MNKKKKKTPKKKHETKNEQKIDLNIVLSFTAKGCLILLNDFRNIKAFF